MEAVLTREEEQEIYRQFDDLLCNSVRCESEEDKEIIRKAFTIAFEAHKNSRRYSGEPYIIHPLAVAKIVSHEIGLGVKAVICALLHDVVEDTEYSLEEVEHHFGPKVAQIIDGLTKVNELMNVDSTLQAENFRKMLLTLSDDVRVILIKLADRLHNMRTLSSMPPAKQKKIASETLYLFAPLAHRLGLYAIKTELEDLAFKYLHPKEYTEILEKLEADESKRLAFINKFSFPIIEKLNSQNISYEISGRVKSVYSIWNKMQTKQIPFEEVYDLFAVRIVFDPLPGLPEKTQCWNIYSIITDIYMPKPERIRDWVSTPKANGYEALHITVMGPEGKWVEVQIRSRRMDDIAERGFAAHWKYKEGTEQHENELDKWLRKIRELLSDPHSNALEFVDDFKLNLFTSEIHVFTPLGEIKNLPKGSTVLDFAYEIHSGLGNHAIGAKVNHKLVPLNHPLTNGDQVEIITSDKKRVKLEWLDYVVTAKAKTAIKDALKSETKNRIEKGKAMLEEKLAQLNLRPSARIFRKILPAYECSGKDELYSKIGSGIISLDGLAGILRYNAQNKLIQYWELVIGGIGNVILGGEKGTASSGQSSSTDEKTPYLLKELPGQETPVSYVIAKCCNPIPGDEVIGYNSPNGTVIVHKAKCVYALRLMSSQSERIIPTRWTAHKIQSFLARIDIEGIEHFGIFNAITSVVTKELKVNMRTLNLSSHDGIFEGFIELYVHSVEDLNKLIDSLKKLKGVTKVLRHEENLDRPL